jgi:hypothetical protein
MDSFILPKARFYPTRITIGFVPPLLAAPLTAQSSPTA